MALSVSDGAIFITDRAFSTLCNFTVLYYPEFHSGQLKALPLAGEFNYPSVFFVPKAQSVKTLNTAKRNSGVIGNLIPKSANGTISISPIQI
ncbi:hypothetical protein [Algoriphagus chordae]|uniref:Uncharacterized protein n=1 Tax=Algoriphagus chordae TaxID=237019 RepID=A0A2W7QQJ4_9BACT|nr:hypothetical protein [Algoriphagus chordae]PZX48300.1 hypothetical protein LV85_03710 [Algoriphagus chordae]